MSDSKKLIEDTFAFARYLSWADLQKTLFETETDIEPVPTEPTAVRKHEWRRFGLMCYWYASLHIVTEAWDQLKFSDPVIDQLLTHPKDSGNFYAAIEIATFTFSDLSLTGKFSISSQKEPRMSTGYTRCTLNLSGSFVRIPRWPVWYRRAVDRDS